MSLVELLLRHGADVNAQVGYTGSAVHTATLLDLDDMLELLVGHGASLEMTDRNGRTPLLIGTLRRQRRSVQMLMKSGAAFSCVSYGSINLLHASLCSGVVDILEQYLTPSDIDKFFVIEKLGRSALYHAATGGLTGSAEWVLRARPMLCTETMKEDAVT